MKISRKRKNSLRLRGFNYSQSGAYFVTMCTRDRDPLFGRIENGMMRLTELGEIAVECWKQIPDHFSNTTVDEFIVMPDHLHGIIVIVDEMRPMTGFVLGGAIQESPRPKENDPLSRRRMILPKLIGRFKQNSAKQINQIRGTPGVPVWQRGYYDHIIRDSDSLDRIRAYIIRNPQRWEMNE